jgi:hypothetical protein
MPLVDVPFLVASQVRERQKLCTAQRWKDTLPGFDERDLPL